MIARNNFFISLVLLSNVVGIVESCNSAESQNTKNEIPGFKPCLFREMAGLQPEEVCQEREFLKRLPSPSGKKNVRPGTNTLIFCGKRGTGKTMAAHELAKESGAHLLEYVMNAFVEKYGGNISDALENIYNEAQRIVESEDRPVIILFDDIGDENQKNVLLILNAYLQKNFKNPYIVTILTTNKELSSLEPGLKSRCDNIIEFSMPDRDKRIAAIAFYANMFGAHGLDNKSMEELAGRFKKIVSCRDIEAAFKYACRLAEKRATMEEMAMAKSEKRQIMFPLKTQTAYLTKADVVRGFEIVYKELYSELGLWSKVWLALWPFGS